ARRRHETAQGSLTHRYELFRAGRMDRDRIVEVRFARAHRDRDGKALSHLVRAWADHMTADDALLFAHDDELHRGLRLRLREGIEHGHEFGGIAANFIIRE